MKKVVFIASGIGHINTFHIPTIKMFKEKGYKTYVIAKEVSDSPYIDKCYDVPFDRFPITIQNVKNYFKIRKILKLEKFDVVSCHTPAASVLARLAARKSGALVVYMAHGFHFYKGGSKLNNFIYKTIEKTMAHYTDKIITINKDDYEEAQKFHLKKSGEVYYVPGVGIDINKFNKAQGDKKKLCNELNLDEKNFMLISVGELNKNKNHQIVLETLKKMNNSNLNYIICGRGNRFDEYEDFIKKNDLKNVRLLGFRTDVAYLLKSSDALIFPSFREGLPVSVMEAMACGLPILASNIRGCKDLVKNEYNGYLFQPTDIDTISSLINLLKTDSKCYAKLSENSVLEAQNYDISKIIAKFEKIYFK